MSITEAACQITVQRAPTGVLTAKAWGTSRPNDEAPNIDDITKIDVPVNEIEDFVLKVKAPIIIREMLFTLRDHVAWARTSRVDDLTKWEVAIGYGKHPEVLLCHEQMMVNMRTQTQDNFRDLLPLVYMTEFTVKLSARTLFRIHDGLAKLVEGWLNSGDPANDKIMAMFSQFGLCLTNVLSNTPYGGLPMGTYGYPELFPTLTDYKRPAKNRATRLGDFTYVYLHAIPIVLRAQIVRHRPIMFNDTMVDYLSAAAITAPISSKISLAMVMPTAMAVSMLRKRNCWIAQEDLWAPVIAALNEEFGDDGAFMLPCDGKSYCPVGRDNLLRHEGKDPAPACPLWYSFQKEADVKEVEPSGEQRAAMMDYMSKRPLSVEFWKEIYMEAIPDEGA